LENQETEEMSALMTLGEEAQLSQTIEMFEVITQSQPLDCQSLEILKEAYFKLGRTPEAVATSKRIAEAYMHLGQLSSAILEYEGILQGFPDDPDVQTALAEIENKASNLSLPRSASDQEERKSDGNTILFPNQLNENRASGTEPLDGREIMKKIFTESRRISEAEFEKFWPRTSLHDKLLGPVEPFIQVLAEQQLVPIETSLKLLLDKTRLCYLPIEKYDLDVDAARSVPRDVCLRWCILPFDRMSKSVLVATANPFNKQAAHELEDCLKKRLLWYLSSPNEIMKPLRKIFR
jgi:tetratricopeptide (TPR) repeat protein